MDEDAPQVNDEAEAQADAPEAEAQAPTFPSYFGGPDMEPEPEDEAALDEQDEAPDVVGALISALVSGNAGDAQNALALAASAGYDVSGAGSVAIQGKKDLPALEAEAIAAADDDEDDLPSE